MKLGFRDSGVTRISNHDYRSSLVRDANLSEAPIGKIVYSQRAGTERKRAETQERQRATTQNNVNEDIG